MTADKCQIGRAFYTALVAADWAALWSLLHDDVRWSLPGDNAISGDAVGVAAVVARAQQITSYGVNFELIDLRVSAGNVALLLHYTAQRGGLVLDGHLTTVCFIRGYRIGRIETYLPDVDALDAYFV